MVIQVCIGSACHLKGSYDIINRLTQLIKNEKLEDKIDVKAAFCLGHCTEAVSVKFDEKIYSVLPTTVESFFNNTVESFFNNIEKVS